MNISRYPPKIVREILRKEVNFGCPVENCGSPYLQYHHFDPPWNVRHHHNPRGMIALCKMHHPEADNDAWTMKQLRAMKENPYIGTELVGRFNWLRQDLIVIAGAIVQNPKGILRVRGENVVWMERDADSYYRLNLSLRDSSGNVVVKISNNDWVLSNDRAVDVICPPSGKELRVSFKDCKTFLGIKFDDMTNDEFRKRLSGLFESTETVVQRQCEILHVRSRLLAETASQKSRKEKREEYVNDRIRDIGNPERVTTCTLRASLEYPKAKIQLKDGIFVSAGLRMYRGYIREAETVYSF